MDKTIMEQLEEMLDKSFTTNELNTKLQQIFNSKKDFINDEYVWDDIREYNEIYVEDEFRNYVNIVLDETTGIEYVVNPEDTYSLYLKDYLGNNYELVYKIKDYDKCIVTVWDIQ